MISTIHQILSYKETTSFPLVAGYLGDDYDELGDFESSIPIIPWKEGEKEKQDEIFTKLIMQMMNQEYQEKKKKGTFRRLTGFFTSKKLSRPQLSMKQSWFFLFLFFFFLFLLLLFSYSSIF